MVALVRDIMTKGVEMLSPETTLDNAAQRMKELDVGSLPVARGDQIIGIITDRDIVVRGIAEHKDPGSTSIESLMSKDVKTVYDDQHITEAANVMEQFRVRRLIVLDHSQKPVGFLAQTDLAGRSHDQELTGEVVEEISKR